MKTRNAFIAVLMAMFACSNPPTSGNGLSTLGFYSPPRTIIARLEAGRKGYREHFLLGVAYKKEKKYKNAMFHFAQSCFASHRDPRLRLFSQPIYHFVKGYHLKSEYYDDAVFELADLFFLYGEHGSVIKFVDLMSKSRSALYRDAMLLKSKSLSTLKKYDDARTVLTKLENDYDDPDSKSIIRLRTGSLLEKKADFTGAINQYLRVFEVDVKGWQAASAADLLQALLTKNPRKLQFRENLLFAKALYHGKQYKESIVILRALAPASADRADVDSFLVRALTRDNAAAAVQSLIRERSNDAALLKVHGDELWSMGNKGSAITVYQQVVRAGTEPYAQAALQRTAKFLEENKRAGHEQYLTDYKNRYSDDHSGHFLWLMARNLIRGKNNDKALQLLEESVSRYPSGSHSDESRFWLHKIYSARGDNDKALKAAIQMAVTNPDSPYTWLLLKQQAAAGTLESLEGGFKKALDEKNGDAALYWHALIFVKERSMAKRTARIGKLNSPDISRYRDLEKSIAAMKTSSGYGGVLKRIEPYFALGYSAGINREMKLLPRTREARKDKYIALAHFSRKYRYAFLEVFSCLELLKLFELKENIALMPSETVEMLFPVPFQECVSQYGALYSVDTEIIYALMKAESLFKQNAVSSAGASGLMQLMPSTARGIARGLRLKDYDLADPCTSIQLGTKYISGLMREFRGNYQYMVAAYNAGAGNVDKWKERYKNEDMDYFTEFTPFIETRYYILRTDKFVTQYGLIRGGKTGNQ
ncbi:MAG: transglycosylase SLT domain-containing protein [Spirochaetes bacterium]|nr:transglycosylase SLT domain-containing protein [Spirochaetota bacterium]